MDWPLIDPAIFRSVSGVDSFFMRFPNEDNSGTLAANAVAAFGASASCSS